MALYSSISKKIKMSYTYTSVYQFHTIVIFYNNVKIAARCRLQHETENKYIAGFEVN